MIWELDHDRGMRAVAYWAKGEFVAFGMRSSALNNTKGYNNGAPKRFPCTPIQITILNGVAV